MYRIPFIELLNTLHRTRNLLVKEQVSLCFTNRKMTCLLRASLGFPDSSVDKESTCYVGDPGSIPGSGRFTGEGIGYPLQYSWASLVAQLVKNPSANGRPGFDPWVGKIPWRKEQLPTPVFWPGEFHGLYSPCLLYIVLKVCDLTGLCLLL